MKTFKQDILDQDIPVSSLLRRAKSLAAKLNQAEFLKWIDRELNGYADDDKYPEYRKTRGQVKAWNPYHGWVPVVFADSRAEETVNSRYTKQSVGEIEDLLKAGNAEYEMPYPASVANKILADAPIRTKASLFFGRSVLVGLLNAVRNALQDWTIELEKKNIKVDEDTFAVGDKEKAKSIEAKYRIEKIENFSGNLGENNSYQQPGTFIPTESFYAKFFWYGFVALIVLILGNIISALLLRYFTGQ